MGKYQTLLPDLHGYDGRYLPGVSIVKMKIDGIQAFLKDGEVVSRALKPLHAIHPKMLRDGLVYEAQAVEGFKRTQELLRSHKPDRMLIPEELHVIWPPHWTKEEEHTDLTGPDVEKLMFTALSQGYEGLVIIHEESQKLFKVKPKDNHDVPITGIIPGKGKHEGRMGALMTPMGKVGTGFSDALRGESWEIGEIIEVECMELTPAGKFRHPRFVRRRFDKGAV